MHTTATPSKAAASLRMRGAGLRFCIGPNAFGNALGSSLAQANWGGNGQQTDKLEQASFEAARADAASRAMSAASYNSYVSGNSGYDSNTGIGMPPQAPSTFEEDQQQRMDQVVIRRARWSDDQKLAYDFAEGLSYARMSNNQYYRNGQDNATNPITAMGAPILNSLNGAGYDILGMAPSLYLLTTDPHASFNAVMDLGGAVAHPGRVVNALNNKFAEFAAMAPQDRAATILQVGAGGFATAGITAGAPKVLGAMGDVLGDLRVELSLTSNGANSTEAVWLDSAGIRQSQKSISYAKSGGYNLDDISRGFVENPADPRLSIDAVRMKDGLLTSVDNSRPAVLNATGGGQIQVRIRAFDDPLMGSEIDRFTTLRGSETRVPSTWGEAVDARIWKQGDQFMSLYPNGSPFIPKVSGAPTNSIWSQYNQYPWKR